MLLEIINKAIEKKASDIHLVNKLCPCLRVDGDLNNYTEYGVMNKDILAGFVKVLIGSDKNKLSRYESDKQLDTAYNKGDHRFRVHIYKQRNTDTIVIRYLSDSIPKAKNLNLPDVVIDRFTRVKNGLVLVTGTTGSGKSTTLAAMIDHINDTQSKNIITIEDPIEFVHSHKGCVINQREIGEDVCTFADAVRAAMRADPDILLIGEMRDLDTIQNAITMAETGHLVFGTLHTKSTAESIDRIIDVFPAEHQQQIRFQLSNTIQGIISQHLVKKTGGGRIPICEILVANDSIRTLIRERGNVNAILDAVRSSNKSLGGQTIDQSAKNLFINDMISENVLLEFIDLDDYKEFIDVG